MTAGRRRVAKEDRPGWAYHLVTIGVAVAITVVFLLIAAGLGVWVAQSSQDPDVVPGRGVTTTPAPIWVNPS